MEQGPPLAFGVAFDLCMKFLTFDVGVAMSLFKKSGSPFPHFNFAFSLVNNFALRDLKDSLVERVNNAYEWFRNQCRKLWIPLKQICLAASWLIKKLFNWLLDALFDIFVFYHLKISIPDITQIFSGGDWPSFALKFKLIGIMFDIRVDLGKVLKKLFDLLVKAFKAIGSFFSKIGQAIGNWFSSIKGSLSVKIRRCRCWLNGCEDRKRCNVPLCVSRRRWGGWGKCKSILCKCRLWKEKKNVFCGIDFSVSRRRAPSPDRYIVPTPAPGFGAPTPVPTQQAEPLEPLDEAEEHLEEQQHAFVNEQVAARRRRADLVKFVCHPNCKKGFWTESDPCAGEGFCVDKTGFCTSSVDACAAGFPCSGCKLVFLPLTVTAPPITQPGACPKVCQMGDYSVTSPCRGCISSRGTCLTSAAQLTTCVERIGTVCSACLGITEAAAAAAAALEPTLAQKIQALNDESNAGSGTCPDGSEAKCVLGSTTGRCGPDVDILEPGICTRGNIHGDARFDITAPNLTPARGGIDASMLSGTTNGQNLDVLNAASPNFKDEANDLQAVRTAQITGNTVAQELRAVKAWDDDTWFEPSDPTQNAAFDAGENDAGLDSNGRRIVAGGWSAWGAAGACSRSCTLFGSTICGTQHRYRSCTNPAPSVSNPPGASCVGSASASKTCNCAVVCPTPAPTRYPTPSVPSPTRRPTPAPTRYPTPAKAAYIRRRRAPTSSPTPPPTRTPTPAGPPPTKYPTRAPTSSPTPSPTMSPTPAPTSSPTPVPCGWGKAGAHGYGGSSSSACGCNPGQGFRRYQPYFGDQRRRRRRTPTNVTPARYYCHTDRSFSDSRRRGVQVYRRRRTSRRRGTFSPGRRLEEEEGTFDGEQAKTSV